MKSTSAGALVLGATALFTAAAPAAWASGPAPVAPPSSSDVAAAQKAASGAVPTLGRFFASQAGLRSRTVAAADAAATRPRLTASPTAVYELSPGFVSGRSATVARLAFLATPAAAADGQTASVWTARTSSGAWKVVNIASGTDEQTYVRQAGSGAIAFHEPQIDAWYALRDGKVTPLNDSARAGVRAGTTLAAYQRLVQRRYADKMPGSAYAKTGAAGGYAAAPGGSYGAPADKGGSTGSGRTPFIVGGVVLLGAAGAVGARRLRRNGD
jgi:hypothetical protein